jgi:hypothetical protein
MIVRCLVVVLACAACGDNLHRDDLFTAVSGSRLVLQKYRFDDGTEQAVASEFYDTQVHARCTPQPGADGAVRCVPVADDVGYVDPACTIPVGLGRTIEQPTHFIVYDTLPAGRVVSRVFRAGAATTPIAQYYGIAGGACVGPVAVPPELVSFFEVGDELDIDTLVAFHEDELGDGRIGVQIRTTDDGLRAPFGLRDRALDVPCVPRLQGDGSVGCEPSNAAVASYFGDPACHEPVVAAGPTASPAIARVVEPSGCASYHHVGPELSVPLYLRAGDTCTPVAAPVDNRLFPLAAPIELPVLGRSLEAIPGRRLQRIILDHDGLRFLDDRLFDTATGADCGRRTLRDGVRCLPTTIASTTLFLAGCAEQVRVAEVPQHTCTPLAYATSNRPFQIREIGDPVSSALFRLDGDACQPYTSAPGTELRALGPPLDLTTFESAIYFGERSR